MPINKLFLRFFQVRGLIYLYQLGWRGVMPRRFQPALYLTLCALVITAAHAQTATGTIGGQVLDAGGALIPNVKVTIGHSPTGQARTVVTNGRGEFLAPVLPIGQYEVSAEFTGFKRQSVSGILLRVDQTVSLPIQ